MNKIKKLRKEKLLTLRGVSEKAGVAASYISKLENDLASENNPSKEIMEKIALALESTVPKVFY